MTVVEWLGTDNQLGIDIWEKKYRFENETFDEWLDRISNGNNELRQLIIEKKFLFGGRILSGRGLHKKGRKITYSNCYVLDTDDNIEAIFDTAKYAARTFSYGGGVGIPLGKLAPKDARVNNAAIKSSGAVSFMDVYSTVTGTIGQNGRRGALMLCLPSNHPDIEDFIDIKTDLSKVTYANISVLIDDKFMEAVKNDTDYELIFTRKETNETIIKTIKAKELFHKLAKNNWNYAEPGALFWDKVTGYNLMSNSKEFKLVGTNPCGELPLVDGGACLLGSINLSEFVVDKMFDYGLFENAVRVAVVALNEAMEEGRNLHPLESQKQAVDNWKSIGLGIMGLADMLIKLEIEYGSKESICLCDRIGSSMSYAAMRASCGLAAQLGSFPNCNKGEITSTKFFLENSDNELKDKVETYGLRNAQILTCAPTGSISTMIGVSGGIEPIYAISYNRTTKSLHDKDVAYEVFTPIVKEYMDKHNITDKSDIPRFFVSSADINYKNRIDMQAVWQKHIDNSISSTVNVPNNFTVEDAESLYLYAWKKGLKGVTIFRDGCARTGILNTSNSDDVEEDKVEESDILGRGDIINVNDDVVGKKRSLTTGCGNLHCEAFFDPPSGELMEVYLSKGSTGGCNNTLTAVSRLVSIASRGGIDIYTLVDQLNSCGSCPSYAVRTATKHDTSSGSCCPGAVGRALLDMYKEYQSEITCEDDEENRSDEVARVETQLKEIQNNKDNMYICPECGEKQVVFEMGCITCKNCGYSKCG